MTAQNAPQILGVLNLSPESMVEDSIAIGPEAISHRAATLARTGADWIDLGGRSITPDAPMIDDAQEQHRLGPALDLLKAPGSEHFHYRVSVDTWSPETARFGLEQGADGINFTGRSLPEPLLDAVASRNATLFVTFMPYENAYSMRDAEPKSVGLEAVLDHLGPKVEAARHAGVEKIVIDPNLGIIHPTTDDYQKIHQQLAIVWNLDALRALACPILLYAARKPERLARIMMASAVLHAGPDYIRTHTPEMIWRLHQGKR
ncbi:MAG: dihydropteroate synthase [bacterium]|nr:dihydropteroate synthase [bacterium]